jgi:hypothetical protein
MILINWAATSHATWMATTAGRLVARNLTRQWRGRPSRVAAEMRQRGLGSSWEKEEAARTLQGRRRGEFVGERFSFLITGH